MDEGVALDLVRASVNLVLAGLLIVIGTSLKLPLSTTYVAFMVAMGSSLADRAWGRETAVYRITGVITVIGGWFITAGAAFILSFTIASLNHLGGFVAMVLLIVVLVLVLVNNNRKFKKKQQEETVDTLYREIVKCQDKQETWRLLVQHVARTQKELLDFSRETLKGIVGGLVREDVRELRSAEHAIGEQKAKWKRYRRKEILGMRRIDHMQAVEKNTWFHLGCNCTTQLVYCLKRMVEPALEHVDNNFNPLPAEYRQELTSMIERIDAFIVRTQDMIVSGNFAAVDELLVDGMPLSPTFPMPVTVSRSACSMRTATLR